MAAPSIDRPSTAHGAVLSAKCPPSVPPHPLSLSRSKTWWDTINNYVSYLTTALMSCMQLHMGSSVLAPPSVRHRYKQPPLQGIVIAIKSAKFLHSFPGREYIRATGHICKPHWFWTLKGGRGAPLGCEEAWCGVVVPEHVDEVCAAVQLVVARGHPATAADAPVRGAPHITLPPGVCVCICIRVLHHDCMQSVQLEWKLDRGPV